MFVSRERSRFAHYASVRLVDMGAVLIVLMVVLVGVVLMCSRSLWRSSGRSSKRRTQRDEEDSEKVVHVFPGDREPLL